MVEKLANIIVSQMEEEKLLNCKIREHYVYALVIMIEKWVTIISIISLSIIYGQFIPTILFCLFFLSLRKRTGGYHAEKFWQCYLETIVTYILIIFVCSTLVEYMNIVYIFLAGSIILISIIGTVNHPNMAMDELEIQESKSATRYLLCLECMVILAAIILNVCEICICYMSMAIILCAILISIAKIVKQEV